jgi:TfoX/Sxy family transcriptional regulator of competence genes
MGDIRGHLKDLVQETTDRLQSVTWRRMFGCDAWFARGQIFSLIWQTGRVGVRLPDEQAFAEAISLGGAEPWSVGAKMKPMAHWVLLPEDHHEDLEQLEAWLRRAHAIAAQSPPAKKKKPAVRKKATPR